MLKSAPICTCIALAAALVSGQPPSPQREVLHLKNNATSQDLYDIAQTIGVVSRMRVTEVDAPKNTIFVSGTARQIELARWLAGELDRPSATPLPPNSAQREYRTQGSAEDVIRVFHLPRSETRRDLQEVMTLIRSVADISFIYPYYSKRALSMRGTADQVLLTEWLINTLDRPADDQTLAPPTSQEYRMPGGDELARVFYLPQGRTSQELGIVFTAVRAAAKTGHLYLNSQRKALAVRGTPAQMAIAERVIREGR